MSNISLQTTTKKPFGRTYAIIAVLILVLSVLLVYNLTNYVAKENTLLEKARKEAQTKTQEAADQMEKHFKQLKQIADQEAREVEAQHYSKQAIKDRVYSVMLEHPEVFGFSIAYKPYKYDRETNLYAPFCYRKDGTIISTQIEDEYDYTREKSGLYWYVKPLQQGAGWTEPYFGTISQSLLSVYSVPFYGLDPVTGKREIVGVVSIRYSLDDIGKYIKALDFGWGYAYLISREGTYISHPTREKVTKQMQFSSNSDVIGSDGIYPELAKKLRANNGTLYEFKNTLIEQEAWVLHQRIPSTGYELGAFFIKDAMVKDAIVRDAAVKGATVQDAVAIHKNWARHKLIIVSVLAILILALLSIFVTKGYPSTEKRLWGISIFISALLVLGIATVWFVSTKYNTYSDNEIKIVTDEETVKGIVAKISHELEVDKRKTETLKAEKPVSKPTEGPILIPTGVFIQSLDFENANNVKLTGYVWQKYPKDFPVESQGFVLPEAISSSVEPAYTKDAQDGQTIIGWHFDATLRQEFDYSRYPLDNKDVWLRMWPKDFNMNVFLTPDFSSYPLINPDTTPGIDKDIILSGWDIKQSFFCYYTNSSYNSTFGIRDYIGQSKFPELAFMALISRKFMNPFIAYLLPFLVMAFMLFGTLALIYIIESKAEKFDFSAAGVLAACTGLFFSVVVTHDGLRERITVNGILYLEYFYFVLYAAVILVIVDAFLVAFKSKSWLVQYKDNIIPKILYWPSMLAVILAITICLFR